MDFASPSLPAVAAVIPDRYEISRLSYHEDGKRLFAASEEGSSLKVVDCVDGKSNQPPLKCEREKISCVEATHHEDCVLFSGKGSPEQPTSQRYAINYWSVYDNKILRKFKGHSDQVISLSMCPADDSFLSSSLDGTVRLWTAQSAGCLAEMKLPMDKADSPCLGVYDSTGLVFGITASMKDGAGHFVHLYDARNYSGGAFAEFKISHEDLQNSMMTFGQMAADQAAGLSRAAWTSMSFNNSGNQILLGSALGTSIILDGFEGTIKGVYSSASRPTVACFTADDQTLLMGNIDGTIQCFNLASGMMQKQLQGHPGPVKCLAANPKYAQFASSCSQVALWSW